MGLTSEDKRQIFWVMLLSRRIDERAWALHREGKIIYHISAIGHEAAQAGMAFAIHRTHDWVVPYYRDLALMLALGFTPRSFILGLMGKREDPNSGGRQMPNHWSYKDANVLSVSSTAASQVSHAVGIGMAIKMHDQDKVVLTTCGEGATSQGEWYEAVNWAAIHKLPVVFVVENNHYAISTSQEMQMAVESVAARARGLGLPGTTVDGTDAFAVYEAVHQAVEKARAGSGPGLVEALCNRITPHSSDDDDRAYRTRREVESYKESDPLSRMRSVLENDALLTAAAVDELDKEIAEIVDEAVYYAEKAPYPAPEEGQYPVYAEWESNA